MATKASNLTTKQRKSRDNLIPFKPGQSGNPKGRAKKGTAVADILRAVGEAKYRAVDKDGSSRDITKIQAVIERIYMAALAGDMAASKLILEYEMGKPRQSVEIEQRGRDVIIEINAPDKPNDG